MIFGPQFTFIHSRIKSNLYGKAIWTVNLMATQIKRTHICVLPSWISFNFIHSKQFFPSMARGMTQIWNLSMKVRSLWWTSTLVNERNFPMIGLQLESALNIAKAHNGKFFYELMSSQLLTFKLMDLIRLLEPFLNIHSPENWRDS